MSTTWLLLLAIFACFIFAFAVIVGIYIFKIDTGVQPTQTSNNFLTRDIDKDPS